MGKHRQKNRLWLFTGIGIGLFIFCMIMQGIISSHKSSKEEKIKEPVEIIESTPTPMPTTAPISTDIKHISDISNRALNKMEQYANDEMRSMLATNSDICNFCENASSLKYDKSKEDYEATYGFGPAWFRYGFENDAHNKCKVSYELKKIYLAIPKKQGNGKLIFVYGIPIKAQWDDFEGALIVSAWSYNDYYYSAISYDINLSDSEIPVVDYSSYKNLKTNADSDWDNFFNKNLATLKNDYEISAKTIK